MCKEYEDAFCATYREPTSFLEFLKERNRNTFWRRERTPDLRYAVLEENDGIRGGYGSYTEEEWAEIAEDTRQNTMLVLQTEYDSIPVRDCAIQSILQRAGVSGRALPKLEKSVYTEVLNHCMAVSQGQSLLCISDGKLSALHGGDSRGYTVLEIPELFRSLQTYLDRRFPCNQFIGGYYCHSLVTATWELGAENGLVTEYRELLDKFGLESSHMIPTLRFTCSDVGTSGANLFPSLLVGENRVNLQLGKPIKQIHKGGATLESFQKQLDLIYPHFQSGVKALTELVTTMIFYPINCMVGICKELRIPQRLAAPAVDRFWAQNGDDICTAHEIYCALSEIIFDLQQEGASGLELAQMEETISRVVHLRWKNYDFAGEVKW